MNLCKKISEVIIKTFCFLCFSHIEIPSKSKPNQYILHFLRKNKYLPLFFIMSITLLFSFNASANPGILLKKIRTAITDFFSPPRIDLPRSTQQISTVDYIKASLRFHNDDLFLEDATDQEILDFFKSVFERTETNSGPFYNISAHNGYKALVFGTIWKDREFRGFIFDSITKRDLTEPDYLLKWWEEAKVVGAESRLVEYTEASLAQIRLGQPPDSFMEAALKAARENRNFRREWTSLFRDSESSVIEQDFDILMRDSQDQLPDDYLPGPSWDEIRNIDDPQIRNTDDPVERHRRIYRIERDDDDMV